MTRKRFWSLLPQFWRAFAARFGRTSTLWWQSSVLLLASVAPAQAQVQDAPVLTQHDAVVLARADNRNTQKASLDVARANAGIHEARSYFFPQTDVRVIGGYAALPLQLTIPAGALGTYSGTGPLPGKDITLSSTNSTNVFVFGSVAQPVSQLYKIHLGVEAARLQRQVATQAEALEREKTAAQVKAIYQQICQLEAKVESDAVRLRSLEETQRTVSNQVEQGTALRASSIQIDAMLAQQRVGALHDADDLTGHQEQLNRLLGRDLDTAFRVEPLRSPTIEEIDLSTARATALRQRPELKATDLQAAKAELDVRRQRADYIPDISAQVTYLGIPNTQFVSPNVVNLGLSLNWQNPWDWGRRRAQISGLKDVAQQQHLTADDTRQQVLVDVSQRFRTLQEARLAAEAAKLSQQASLEKLRNATDQYKQQTVLLDDVLKQTADFQQRSAEYSEALTNLWSAQADLERALGEE